MTLAELADHLLKAHGERFVPSVLWRFFDRRNITFKKTSHASEQDRPDVAAERAAWKASQPEIDIHRLVFIDETGASTKMARRYRLRLGRLHRPRVSELLCRSRL
jgi:hypothetical protein